MNVEKAHSEELEKQSGSKQLEAGFHNGDDSKAARTLVLKMDVRCVLFPNSTHMLMLTIILQNSSCSCPLVFVFFHRSNKCRQRQNLGSRGRHPYHRSSVFCWAVRVLCDVYREVCCVSNGDFCLEADVKAVNYLPISC